MFMLVLVIMSYAYPTPQLRLSTAASLRIATWNCNGLSKTKKDLAKEMDFDILCLPETHKYTDNDSHMLYAAPPPDNDPWSGVSLMLSNRVRKYVTHWDFIGSRIVYCRLKGHTCNYFVIGIYIPQSKRINPDQSNTYDELAKLLRQVSNRDCIILLGDFNSRLARDIDNHTGHWSIHNRNDAGGDRLLEIMRTFTLKCVSTCFQPPRKHSNATYLNVQPQLPPSQIDHIIVSSRWSSSVRGCKTMWGLSMRAHGRKYDHSVVAMTFKLKQRCQQPSIKRDFKALKSDSTSNRFENKLQEELAKTDRPQDTHAAWARLKLALQSARETLPLVKRTGSTSKHETSAETRQLIQKRAASWEQMSVEERKSANKAIKRSARNDYRSYVDKVASEIEAAERVGDTTSVFKIAKVLSSKGKGNKLCQPSKDEAGNLITSTEQQLEAWAVFLEKKFSARPDETLPDLRDIGNEAALPGISLEETQACLNKTKLGKAPGPDGNPAEVFRNNTSIQELNHVLQRIFDTEDIPPDFVLGEMLNFYKKKDKNNRANYRALGLLNHSYKVFSRILLKRIVPYIDPKLSDMQSGFREARGCRDNILILTMAIRHLLKDNTVQGSRGIITYIDFVAAFDSILHSYMLQSLLDYGVPRKYVRLVAKIYQAAAVQVRIQEASGERKLSRQIPIRRGAIQGDIPSPVYFLVALDKLIKEYGGTQANGIQLTPELKLKDMEYADDAGLADKDTAHGSQRVTTLDSKANEKAGMSVSVPKTKVQHICEKPAVSETSEHDIENLPAEEAFTNICDRCDRAFGNKHGLMVHKGRWCRGRRKRKPPSRKGTVADRIIKLRKVKAKQAELPHVMLGNQTLENVYSFVYLGSEVAGDGDPTIPVKHRTNVAWGRYGEYRQVLTNTKLSINIRLRLYSAIVGSTMLHGSSAWIANEITRKTINGVNSKMLSLISKRSIHDEARNPSLNTVSLMMKRRWSYLGHLLRLEESRTVRRFLLELSPERKPFEEGTLLDQIPFDTVEEAIAAAQDRQRWTELFSC